MKLTRTMPFFSSTPVSKSVIVSNLRSFEACELVLCDKGLTSNCLCTNFFRTMTDSVPDRHHFYKILERVRAPQKDVTKVNALLPEEILRIIFSFLPPKDLKSAVLVCKLWSRVEQAPGLQTRACKSKWLLSDPLEVKKKISSSASPRGVKSRFWQLLFLGPETFQEMIPQGSEAEK